MKEHNYEVGLEWTGNKGLGTKRYDSYERSHTISIDGKHTNLEGSSDPSFRGDPSCYNPEELFLSSIAACHMLWYLHLCSSHGIIVTSYHDNAKGTMQEKANGSGRFTSVTLYPKVIITDQSMLTKAIELHSKANKMCFIANSCNFPISHIPNVTCEKS